MSDLTDKLAHWFYLLGAREPEWWAKEIASYLEDDPFSHAEHQAFLEGRRSRITRDRPPFYPATKIIAAARAWVELVESGQEVRRCVVHDCDMLTLTDCIKKFMVVDREREKCRMVRKLLVDIPEEG